MEIRLSTFVYYLSKKRLPWAWPKLGRFSEPFLSRFSTQMDNCFSFRGPETPTRSPPTAHTLAPTSHSPDYSAPMGGGNVGANVCAVGGDILGVSGPQKPKQSSIWVEKRLRNGSETAQRNGQVSAKPTVNAFSKGNKRSWGVAFPSDQASRRASPARARFARRAVFPDALPFY